MRQGKKDSLRGGGIAKSAHVSNLKLAKVIPQPPTLTHIHSRLLKIQCLDTVKRQLTQLGSVAQCRVTETHKAETGGSQFHLVRFHFKNDIRYK